MDGECAAEEGAKDAACISNLRRKERTVVKQHLQWVSHGCSFADINYKRLVMFENRARYLADPEHHAPRACNRPW
jgi:hypothetical protein